MNSTKRLLVAGSLFSATLLAGCVSRSDYDALQTQKQQIEAQNQQLQQQLAASQQQVGRYQQAIKYTHRE